MRNSQHPTVKEKVICYLIQNQQVLVFEQPDFPNAGFQVPAGTKEPDESWKEAAMREFIEETGRKEVSLVKELGELWFDFRKFSQPKDEVHHRRFYLFSSADNLPSTWEHHEKYPSSGQAPILFRFSWLSIEKAKKRLIADQGLLLQETLARLVSKEEMHEKSF